MKLKSIKKRSLGNSQEPKRSRSRNSPNTNTNLSIRIPFVNTRSNAVGVNRQEQQINFRAHGENI